ncbi:MAG: pilin [Clostridia bacterium]|nr:pilin [Clostridia bacterium]
MFGQFLASSISEGQLRQVVKPLLDVCGQIVPVLLAVVGAVGAIFCIVLGVKYARADDPQEHEKAKNGLKNAIIGFVLIFVLLVALQIAVSVLQNWWATYPYDAIT